MTTHPTPAQLEAFARGLLGADAAGTVDEHVTDCAGCQQALAAELPAPSLDRMWDGLADRLCYTRTSVVERTLDRMGVPARWGRCLTASPLPKRAWLRGMSAAVVLLLLLVAALQDSHPLAFMVVAPLLPMVAATASGGVRRDPARELLVAAPVSRFQVVAIRALPPVAGSVVLIALVAALHPALAWTSLAWMSPALALPGIALALETMVGTGAALTLTAGIWTVTGIVTAGPSPASPSGVFGMPGQLVVAAAGVVAVWALHRRLTAGSEVTT